MGMYLVILVDLGRHLGGVAIAWVDTPVKAHGFIMRAEWYKYDIWCEASMVRSSG